MDWLSASTTLFNRIGISNRITIDLPLEYSYHFG
jgi:hypothetical protein